MIVKEALLQGEKEQIKEFLTKFSLKMDEVEGSLYLEDDDKIVGTISYLGNIIKCLAVDPLYQSENAATLLINELISRLNEKNIYSYFVFTKPMYQNIFLSFGFRLIVKDDKVVFLEGGNDKIEEEIKKIKRKLEFYLGPIEENSDIACVIVNANPMTTGHEYLIETASKNHDQVVVFVVEEDKSIFSFQERLTLVYLACKRLENVAVIPSSKYIVSSLTFPSYFLPSDSVDTELARIDALVYKNYFKKIIHFKKRYLGKETKEKMVKYNEVLKEELGEDIIEVERYVEDGVVVSASLVRKYLENKDLDSALKYIPKGNQTFFSLMVKDKYGI